MAMEDAIVIGVENRVGAVEEENATDEEEAGAASHSKASEDYRDTPSSSRSRPIADDYRAMLMMNDYRDDEEGSSLTSSLALTPSDVGVDEDESLGANPNVVKGGDDDEDIDDDTTTIAFAPDDSSTAPPDPYDTATNSVDGSILAMQIAELNDTIAALEMRAVAAEDEVSVERARLDEALEARERLGAEYAYAARKYVDLKRRLVDEVDVAAKVAAKDERKRSRAELKRLKDEHKKSLEATSQRVGRLRGSLRSANDRKRRLEKERDDARRKMDLTEKRVGQRYADEIVSLKRSLAEREGQIGRMERMLLENEGIAREERETLLADIM